MTTFTAREVRAWAAANDIHCLGTGRVPQRVIDAYLAAVHPDAVPANEADDDEPENDAEEPMFRVTIEIPGDPDAGADIAGHILEAVYTAYEAGRAIERTRMLEQLGVTP